MIIITSRTNPLIKETTVLHTKKGRTQYGLFIAEGAKVIETLLHNQFVLKNIFVTEQTLDNVSKAIHKHSIVIIPDSVMQKISTAKTPSGMLATFEIPQKINENIEPGIVLAQITDPGNMGTLLRTAAAMNVGSIVVVEGCDVWSPKVVQASAGNIIPEKLHFLDWNTLLERKGSIELAALVVNNGQNPSNLNGKQLLLVVGNESRGLPAQWVADCKFKAQLPMPGETESLNAAIAGSIALYIGWSE